MLVSKVINIFYFLVINFEKEFTITVNNLMDEADNDILSFTIPGQTEATVIDTDNYTIDINMPVGTPSFKMISPPSLCLMDESNKIFIEALCSGIIPAISKALLLHIAAWPSILFNMTGVLG
mgnify:CR=1 FL=1